MTETTSDAVPLTLAIDIGGTNLKAGVLDGGGNFVTGPSRLPTPAPATPEAVLSTLQQIASQLGPFARVSAGFPGMVRRGTILTAPNLGTGAWQRFPLAEELSRRFAVPARVLNDAEVQGFGVIAGVGLECVITLGTGVGFALYQDGMVTPHLELAQHIAKGKRTYDHYVGVVEMRRIGRQRWNRRVKKVIEALAILTTYDTLLIGGGNAKFIDFTLPADVRIVPNTAGITGGVRLWEAKFDSGLIDPPAGGGPLSTRSDGQVRRIR